MYIKDIDPVKLSLLTPEQMKTVERWLREAQERAKYTVEFSAAYRSGGEEKAVEICKQILSLDAEYCEHGRHRYSAQCAGCDEIEKILFPESREED
jgi:hypothetical protein